MLKGLLLLTSMFPGTAPEKPSELGVIVGKVFKYAFTATYLLEGELRASLVRKGMTEEEVDTIFPAGLTYSSGGITAATVFGSRIYWRHGVHIWFLGDRMGILRVEKVSTRLLLK